MADQTLTGTEEDDVLKSGSGSDTLDGGAGNDTLTSGSGNDTVLAGDGDDTVKAGSGDDFLDGGSGNDVLDGGAGDDVLHGGDGDDHLKAGSGADRLYGDAGNDVLEGAASADLLVGGEGSDILIGNSGRDTALFSGSVLDYIIEASGKDFLVTHLPTGDVDTVINVEILQFDDQIVYLDGTNNAPLAVADTFSVKEDTTLVLSAADLIGNDVEFDGEALTIVSVQSSFGSVQIEADGSIRFTPIEGFSGPASFTYTVADESGATSSASVLIDVEAVADAPSLVVQDAGGNEDSAISLDIFAALNDTNGALDGLEVLSITISGVPAGAALSAGTDNGHGSYELTLEQLDGLFIVPPPNSDDDFQLDVTATSQEPSNGDISSVTLPISVTVNAVADRPNISIDAPFELVGRSEEIVFDSPSSGSENHPSILGLDNGDYVMTWTQSIRNNQSPKEVKSQIFSADGTPLSDEISVSSDVIGSSSFSTAVPLGTGGHAIVWAVRPQWNGTSFDGDWGVYARYFDATGNPISDGQLVSRELGVGGQIEGVNATESPDGGIIVTYNYRDHYTPDWNLFAQKISSVGALETETLVAESKPTRLYDDAITLSDGSVIVSYVEIDQAIAAHSSNPTGRIFSVRLDQDGAVVGEPFLVSGTTPGQHSHASTAALDDGGFVVTWQHDPQNTGSDWGTYGQKYAADGSKIGEEFFIKSFQNSFDPVVALPDGGFVVIYDWSDNDGTGIFGQRFGSEATEVGEAFLINQDQVLRQNLPSASLINSDQLVVAWSESNPYDPFGPNLTLRSFDLSYQIQGNANSEIPIDLSLVLGDMDGSETASVLISGVPNGAFLSAGVSNGDGSFTLAATDLVGLSITPPEDSASDFSLTVVATSTEASNGDQASKTLNLSILVDAAAEATLVSLEGSSGNDILQGTDLDELFTGGLGDDLFVFSDNNGNDVINDFAAGAQTEDTIDLSGVTNQNSFADVQAASSQAGNDTVFQLSANDSITLIGVNIGDLSDYDFIF